ncbi:MAG: 30S ribosomal protein S2 [Phycisphaerae bacterium]|nr:30S ribosomal protein S2 [Phycisphaerae bacterium]
MSKPLVRELIDAGAHFGHRVSRWNPKMAPYILGKRGLIHIIDIKETLKGLLRAKKFVTKVVNGGKDVLFVGTKRQAREIVRMQAARCEMPYVCERWLGGTLTNFRTIRSRLARLEELEALDASGAMGGYSKKMESSLKRERRKIQRNLEGIRNMTKVPGALILVDVRREHIAVKEAKKLGIPTLCLLDTDGDPDVIDLPIPGNDDAMRSIEVVLSQLADAVMEGKAGRDKEEPPQEDEKRPARRRSARAMATAPTDAAPTDAAEAPADVAVADQNPDAGAPEADAAPVTPEPAPSAETAEADPAEPAQSEGETEPQTP